MTSARNISWDSETSRKAAKVSVASLTRKFDTLLMVAEFFATVVS